MSSEKKFDPPSGGPRPGKSSWTHSGHSVREQLHYVHEPAAQNEHQREMSFLRHLMLYDETEERHVRENKLTCAESNERCARRAVWLMAVFTALAVVGLGYAAMLLEDFPPNSSQFVTRIFCALGLASLVSLLTFVGFWLVSRGKLDDERDGCRRLVTRIVESRLGKPAPASAAERVGTEVAKENETPIQASIPLAASGG
ncbi:MAG TPA: hypothetical protein VK846_01325 [Candidatus Limnocylindria bacterium]|nr:hypothetical protein [Candidatus Limnocylindria bacterium]